MAYTCESPDEVLKVIKDKEIAIIDLRFTDLPGLWQHFSVPPAALDHDSFAEGVGFDGSSIRGFQEIQESDMLVVPDPTTAFLDPFSEAQTLVLICNVRTPSAVSPTGAIRATSRRKPRPTCQYEDRRHRLSSGRNSSISSSMRSATIRAPTTATMKSMPSRRTGRQEERTGRTSATSCGRRKGISRPAGRCPAGCPHQHGAHSRWKSASRSRPIIMRWRLADRARSTCGLRR